MNKTLTQHKSGRKVVASVQTKWRPYNPKVIQQRIAEGEVTPKAGFYVVMVKAGAGCKKYMESLLLLHFAGKATYEWPKFPEGDWSFQWDLTDGMHLWHVACDYDEHEPVDPDILNEAERLLPAFIEANPNHFQVTP